MDTESSSTTTATDTKVDAGAATTAAAADTKTATTTAGDGKGGDGKTATTTTSADGDKGKDGGAKDGTGKVTTDPKVVTYTDFTIPKGMTADPKLMDSARGEFSKLGLTQEQAQGMMNLYGGLLSQRDTAVAEERAGWKTASAKDTEFVGDDGKLKDGLKVAGRALSKFGTPALVKFLDSGPGDHPEMIRFMYRVGKLVREDSSMPGGQKTATSGTSLADRMYPARTAEE